MAAAYCVRHPSIHHYHAGDEINCSVCRWGSHTGLEASRAPYSKSHARRLKRKEKEELTAGGLGSLKAALPSIAPTTRTTPATTITGDRSAGELDAAATTTVTAAAIDASVKPTIDINKLKSKQQQPIADQSDVPPSLPTTRPGQIGEGHGAPLVKSQRRRALYGLIYYIAKCHFAFAAHLFFFFNFASSAGRPNVSVNP